MFRKSKPAPARLIGGFDHHLEECYRRTDYMAECICSALAACARRIREDAVRDSSPTVKHVYVDIDAHDRETGR